MLFVIQINTSPEFIICRIMTMNRSIRLQLIKRSLPENVKHSTSWGFCHCFCTSKVQFCHCFCTSNVITHKYLSAELFPQSRYPPTFCSLMGRVLLSRQLFLPIRIKNLMRLVIELFDQGVTYGIVYE